MLLCPPHSVPSGSVQEAFDCALDFPQRINMAEVNPTGEFYDVNK